MSSRLVKQQLADLLQTATPIKGQGTAAGVKKRKHKKSLKKAAAKAPARDADAIRLRNLKYYEVTTVSEKAAATAALMAEAGLSGGPPPAPAGASLDVSGLTYHPAGAEAPLLSDVSLSLPPRSLGLVYGRSGAGKTTLLQLLAGLQQPTSGRILISAGAVGAGQAGQAQSAAERLARVGLVFQFPERHFLGDTLQQELAFAWPQTNAALGQLAAAAQVVLPAVGLGSVPLGAPLRQLSDGYQRRAALATALVRRPAVLLLDEPLAGLDWRARADVASVLGKLKTECTVLVVSHDLRELGSLVDRAWRMLPGGRLEPSPWPVPSDLDSLG
ncbi:hypothetical protein WJX81_004812 [Elliptochloris bilobata]|uniref:ABC transporter domain-containing protein n=1 Tax=Elliptochloris bilobata TaxID=381761 RepID=A0AAW1RHY4_9CHLO